MTRAGFVLVGGRSSRMGRDKALLPLDGETLTARIARIVTASAGCASLIGDPALYAHFGYPVIPDLYPGEGPLGGILTALRHTTADLNLIVACDMPGLTEGLLKDLLNIAEHNCMDILLPTTQDGMPEPLCAVYRREVCDNLARAFDAGIRKVTASFEGLRVAAYSVTEVACFQNLNTPEDWARYAAG